MVFGGLIFVIDLVGEGYLFRFGSFWVQFLTICFVILRSVGGSVFGVSSINR